MNENAKAWVAALRSGDYQQGRGRLRDLNGRYCCLGVACELSVAAGVIPPAVQIDCGGYDYEGLVSSLPGRVQEWLGVNSDLGHHSDSSGKRTSLGARNDDGATFAEIADLIEREPPGLFVPNEITTAAPAPAQEAGDGRGPRREV